VAGQAEVFLANGFDGFISKPIDIRELNASLNKFVRDKQPQEVLEAARAAQATVAAGPPQVGADLAKIFERDAMKAMAALQDYEDNDLYGGDLKMYVTNVHALKSVLANIGEGKLSAMAAELEQAGRDSATDFISDKTATFLAGLRAVLDKLSEAHAEDDDGGHGGEAYEVSGEAMGHLRETLLAIKAACADYDAGGARAALKGLKQRPWPRRLAELLDTISGHLLNSEFEKAEEACKSIDNL
jgi:HPt (histidine-containing phosphotransfer) domain-containing protein